MNRLEDFQKQGIITEFEELTIMGLAKKVVEQLAKKHDNVKQKVGGMMGGKILDHPAKDILNRGKAEGKIEGKGEGKVESILRILRKKGFMLDTLEPKIIGEQNLDILDKWLDFAIDAVTQEEFEKAINK